MGLLSSVQQYREVLDGKLHQRHYGLKSNLMVQWVFLSKARERQFVELLGEQAGAVRCASVAGGFPGFEEVEGVVSGVELG